MAAVSEQDVRAAVEELAAWDELARSPQLVNFLKFVVDATLAGRQEAIKAYSIAVDVFNRPADFDPQSDPIVRVQARRLRVLLERFYALGLDRTGVQIRLPVGSYVPQFTPKNQGARSIWLRRAAVAAGAAAMVAAILVLQPRFEPPLPAGDAPPAMPTVVVAEFEVEGGVPGLGSFADSVEVNALVALSKFGFARAVQASATGGATPELEVGAPLYELWGRLEAVGDEVVVTANLTDKTAGSVVWSEDWTVARVNGEAADVGRELGERIGVPIGPLHKPARAWAANADPMFDDGASVYACLMLHNRAFETFADADVERAAACFDAVKAQRPTEPFVLSAGAFLEVWSMTGARAPQAIALADLRQPILDARQAISLDAEQGFHHTQLGHIYQLVGESDAASRCYAKAVELNPGDSNALAAYGMLLSLSGDYEQGVPLAEAAVSSVTSAPAWYQLPLVLGAYVSGDYERALEQGLVAEALPGRIAAALIVAAAQRAGRDDIVQGYLPRVTEEDPTTSEGVLRMLSRFVRDERTLRLLEDGLADAGIERVELWGGGPQGAEMPD